jgi:hypothetical protein
LGETIKLNLCCLAPKNVLLREKKNKGKQRHEKIELNKEADNSSNLL